MERKYMAEKQPQDPDKPGLTRRGFLRATGVVIGAVLAETQGIPVLPWPGRWAAQAAQDPDVEVAVARSFAEEALANKERLGRFTNKVGWAYSPKPELSLDQMIADMQKMRDLGSNSVYIAHCNPGYIDRMPPEPGLTFAVYHALKNNTGSKGNADRILGGVNRAVEAANRTGLAITLAIGYQIQMGSEWSRVNQNHIRREASGAALRFWDMNDGGVTASPYSPIFRQNITEYWRWVNDTMLSKNPNILALNLGDEPMGSDYSTWAKDAFRQQYNVDFDRADPTLKGKFQSEVLADYAAWSADVWQGINPNVKVFFTYHIQRDKPFFPSFEAIFAKTASADNFVFSNDTHMHDDLPEKPITESEKNLMYGMVRTVSWLSRVYGKGFLPWLGVNGWSLADHSSRKGGISEAQESLRVVTDVAKGNGALIPMVMTWAWNMNGQGIYGYGGLPFNSDQMAQTVSRELSQRRNTLSDQEDGRPDIVYLINSEDIQRRIGEASVSNFHPGDWIDLNQFDFIGQNAIWLSEDGPALEMARQMGSQIIPVSL